MTDHVSNWLEAPRSLSEELFGRPGRMKVFISSKMRGGVFEVERQTAAGAVERLEIARAWYWERDANAGPYCAEETCLAQAATAEGLILILGEELTPITRAEFDVAHGRGIATYIFVDQRVEQDAGAKAFLNQVQPTDAVTRGFVNLSELETHIVSAIVEYSVRAVRRVNFTRGAELSARRNADGA